MNTTEPFPIPQDARDLLANLRISDEETGGRPLLPPGQRVVAEEWLARVLTDFRALRVHIGLLEGFYQTQFGQIPGLPRIMMEGKPLFRLEAAAGFRHNGLLPEDAARAVAERGPGVLPDHDLARLLLNPLALWDVADLIDYLLPAHWLDRMEAVGREMEEEYDLRVPIPGVDDVPLAVQQEDEEELAVAGLVRGRGGRKQRGSDEWELSFEDDAARALARRIAAHAYGDPARPFILTLLRVPVAGKEGLAQARIGMSPAPTKEDFTLTVVFAGHGKRTFTLEVPLEARTGKTREWTYAEPCEPLPATAFHEGQGAVDWRDDWPPVVVV
jgi:hypothetical protein